jgi:hypothetical protein
MTPRRDPAAIEGYLHRLRTRLWPPATDPRVEEVLDELRDHLLSDVEQRVALGADEPSAATRALADLGPLDTLATALRRELIRPRLRRLSGMLLALLLSAAAGWKAVLLFGPAEPWTERAEPGPLALLDEAGEWAGAAALLAALLAVALVARSRPGLPDRLRVGAQRWSLRACWVGIVLGACTAAQLAGYLVLRAVLAPESLLWPAVSAAGMLTLAAAPLCWSILRGVAVLQSR